MDQRSIEKVMERRERGYIWMEKDLKSSLIAGSILIIVFFLIVRGFNPEFRFWVPFVFAALFLHAGFCYLGYKREYKNLQQIARYLDHFEEGDYGYQTDNVYMRPGIRSQVTAKLESLGRQFDVMRQRLWEEKENTKALVTDISHQLKTPLAALKVSFELMGDSKVSKEERHEFWMRGKKETERLAQLLGALTNLSRLEAGMIKLEPVAAGLKETIVRAVNGIYVKAGEKNIAIEMEEASDISIFHDPKWTAEAIANVLDNAVKYSPDCSKIRIRMEPRLSYVLIEVEDEGIGIQKKELQNIFKRFYRGGRPAVEAQEGSGVGLYLVCQILEEQGGSVRALPARERGTIFQLMLPKNNFTLPE